jgi:hypothetical protein
MAKADSATKKETPSKEAAPKDKSAPAADAPKAADASKSDTSKSGTSGGAPKNYSRGEGQKPVTQAYKDNWNAIFGKKKRR